MKLSTKICLSMGLLAVLMAVLGTYLLVEMDSVNEISTDLTDRKMPIMSLVGLLSTNLTRQRTIEMRYVCNTDPAQKEKVSVRLAKWREKVGNEFEQLDKLLYEPNARALLGKLTDARRAYQEVAFRLLDLSRQNKTEEAMTLLNDESREKFDVLTRCIDELTATIQNNAEEANRQGDEMYSRSRMTGSILDRGGNPYRRSADIYHRAQHRAPTGKNPGGHAVDKAAKAVAGLAAQAHGLADLIRELKAA